ncbi:MAG: hypothetical protein V2A76_01000 [Planctomycetota bacterium]
MIFRELSRREHVLLIAALLSGATTFYLATRFSNLRDQRRNAEFRQEVAATTLSGIHLPASEGESPAALNRRLRSAEEGLAFSESAVEKEEARFRESYRPEEFNVAVSQLAAECGVSVIQNVPVPVREVERFLGAGTAGAEEAAPLHYVVEACSQPARFRGLALEGLFENVRSFVRRLHDLERPVAVLKFEVRSLRSVATARGASGLRVDLVLGVL